jgi:hypothetical protein
MSNICNSGGAFLYRKKSAVPPEKAVEPFSDSDGTVLFGTTDVSAEKAYHRIFSSMQVRTICFRRFGANRINSRIVDLKHSDGGGVTSNVLK